MMRLHERTEMRLSVASRAMAATLGAYGLTALITAMLSLILGYAGMTKVEAVTAATLASYAVFAGVAMAAFHSRSAIRAWAWLAGAATPLAALLWSLLSRNPL